MKWDVCRETGWTFDEFDATDAQQLFYGISFAAVRKEIEDGKAADKDE
ncbi:hypothetical protein LCGC14_0623150 [marine sediment metagenome]|uniref:Uncharacterized protein n=1 Tax=marine sediment metagenome TaxID=412755 RepID=A0A0F9UCT6_9ZZZZ